MSRIQKPFPGRDQIDHNFSLTVIRWHDLQSQKNFEGTQWFFHYLKWYKQHLKFPTKTFRRKFMALKASNSVQIVSGSERSYVFVRFWQHYRQWRRKKRPSLVDLLLYQRTDPSTLCKYLERNSLHPSHFVHVTELINSSARPCHDVSRKHDRKPSLSFLKH